MKRWLLTVLLLILVVGLVAGITVYRAPLLIADAIIRLHLRQQHVMSEFVDVDGYKIHYLEAMPQHLNGNAGSGVPLVLVHGLGARGEDWGDMIPTLAANGFHVYALDLLGYGRSPKPDVDYSIGLEEKTVVDFMKATKLDSADIGGWSMGGWIVLKLAVDHPELVRRLVVYDAAGIYFPTTFEGSLFTPSNRQGLVKLQEMLTPAPKHLPGFIADAAIEKLQANAWVLNRSVAAMIGGKDLLDFQLHRIEKPTLIVWGREDSLIPLAVGQKMHQRILASSLLVVSGCGHLAPSECAKPVTQGTLDFLEAIAPERDVERTVAGH